MIRVNIICEGPTEENFVSKVLYPYLINKNIIVTARSLGTGNNYDKLKYNVIEWLKQDSSAWLTTLIDLYGMGQGFPSYLQSKNLQPHSKVESIEKAFKLDIEKSGTDTRKFIPHIQLYEFEAMLFADCIILEEFLSLDYNFPAGSFQTIRDKFPTPEYINDSILTAPSKRILKIVPSYEKVADGILIAEAISLSTIREQCSHFDSWVTVLENLK